MKTIKIVGALFTDVQLMLNSGSMMRINGVLVDSSLFPSMATFGNALL